MRTLIIIGGGLVLLALFALGGRLLGGNPAMITAMKIFIPLWAIAAGINMYIGVAQAGYGFMEELPIFLVIFGAPAIIAGLLWWKFS